MKFSVIVCTYNYAHLLPDALRTLAAQTFQDFELLIVDDGSTDSTREVVQEFAPQFRQCRYLQKPHTGLADSRNFGIQAATGTHLAYLDADDLWSPNYLDAVRRIFEEVPQAELVCCDGHRVSNSGEITGTIYPPHLPLVKGPILTISDLFLFFRYSYPSGTSLIKSLYQRIGNYDVRFPVGHDQHWVIRAAQNGAFCIRLDRSLYLYVQHQASLIGSTPIDKRFDEWLSICCDVFGSTMENPEIRKSTRKLTYRWLPRLLSAYDASTNRHLIKRAMKVHGRDLILMISYLLTYMGLCPLARSVLFRGLQDFKHES
ncbi:MAG: glycosyltransferase [Acidobacteria bacterium]|nr:glycosyltransferase [Acidobacteriota bacterium]